MSKHTPGPWFRDDISYEEGMTDDDGRSITDANGELVAIIEPGACRDANADIIAAAPSMEEALRRILVGTTQTSPGLYPMTKAVIHEIAAQALAEAEGK